MKPSITWIFFIKNSEICLLEKYGNEVCRFEEKNAYICDFYFIGSELSLKKYSLLLKCSPAIFSILTRERTLVFVDQKEVKILDKSSVSCCKNTGVIHPLNLLSQSSNKHLNPFSRTKENIWLKFYKEIQNTLEKEDDFRTREILNNPNNMRHMYTSPFHF